MKNILSSIFIAIIFCFLSFGESFSTPTQGPDPYIYRPSIPVYNGRGVNTSITNGTATTQPTLDSTTYMASDAFVQNSLVRQRATQITTATSGTYNIASLGSGAQIVFLASGGHLNSVLSIASGGSGYAVGDVIRVSPSNGGTVGNYDAVIWVTGVSSGAVTSVSILYGGTGYSTGLEYGATSPPVNSFNTITYTGTLTGNVTVILPANTYLTASRIFLVNNNTTGAYTMTYYLSDGADGHIGTGVTIPQGTNNSCPVLLETDGVNDVWYAAPPVCQSAPNYFSATSSSIGGSALLAGACTTGTVSVTGATTAMGVVVTPAAYPGDGIWWDGYVSSAGTVTVRVCAAVAATPASETYNVRVLQ